MFINVLFTPEEKTFQYRVTSITTGGFKAKPALTKHGLEEVMASKVDLVRSLSGDASILRSRLKECAKCTRLTLSERCRKCEDSLLCSWWPKKDAGALLSHGNVQISADSHLQGLLSKSQRH
jgi:hypothetical protein